MDTGFTKTVRPLRIVFIMLAFLTNVLMLTGLGGLADHYYASARIAAKPAVLVHACEGVTLDASLPASSNRQRTAVRGNDAECTPRSSS